MSYANAEFNHSLELDQFEDQEVVSGWPPQNLNLVPATDPSSDIWQDFGLIDSSQHVPHDLSQNLALQTFPPLNSSWQGTALHEPALQDELLTTGLPFSQSQPTALQFHPQIFEYGTLPAQAYSHQTSWDATQQHQPMSGQMQGNPAMFNNATGLDLHTEGILLTDTRNQNVAGQQSSALVPAYPGIFDLPNNGYIASGNMPMTSVANMNAAHFPGGIHFHDNLQGLLDQNSVSLDATAFTNLAHFNMYDATSSSSVFDYAQQLPPSAVTYPSHLQSNMYEWSQRTPLQQQLNTDVLPLRSSSYNLSAPAMLESSHDLINFASPDLITDFDTATTSSLLAQIGSFATTAPIHTKPYLSLPASITGSSSQLPDHDTSDGVLLTGGDNTVLLPIVTHLRDQTVIEEETVSLPASSRPCETVAKAGNQKLQKQKLPHSSNRINTGHEKRRAVDGIQFYKDPETERSLLRAEPKPRNFYTKAARACFVCRMMKKSCDGLSNRPCSRCADILRAHASNTSVVRSLCDFAELCETVEAILKYLVAPPEIVTLGSTPLPRLRSLVDSEVFEKQFQPICQVLDVIEPQHIRQTFEGALWPALSYGNSMLRWRRTLLAIDPTLESLCNDLQNWHCSILSGCLLIIDCPTFYRDKFFASLVLNTIYEAVSQSMSESKVDKTMAAHALSALKNRISRLYFMLFCTKGGKLSSEVETGYASCLASFYETAGLFPTKYQNCIPYMNDVTVLEETMSRQRHLQAAGKLSAASAVLGTSWPMVSRFMPTQFITAFKLDEPSSWVNPHEGLTRTEDLLRDGIFKELWPDHFILSLLMPSLLL